MMLFVDHAVALLIRSCNVLTLLQFKLWHLFSGLQCHPLLNLIRKTITLVRVSIVYPYMDFQKSTDINMDIYDFWMSVFNYPYRFGYPHLYPSRDIHARTFCNGSVNDKYPWMDIHVYMDISLQLFLLSWISIWISMVFNGYASTDLLWILDPGNKHLPSFLYYQQQH